MKWHSCIFVVVNKPSKWKSAWDLTEKEKEKLKDEKKRKRKKSMIHQGLLELINIGDPAVSSDNTHLRTLASTTTIAAPASLQDKESRRGISKVGFGIHIFGI